MGQHTYTTQEWNNKWVGPYLVYEQLGQGAQGVVLRGIDPLLQRQVAIKIATEDHSVQRMIHEARIISSLDHPNIIRIYHIAQLSVGNHSTTLNPLPFSPHMSLYSKSQDSLAAYPLDSLPLSKDLNWSIVMEYLSGGTLQDKLQLQQHPLDIEDATYFALQTASALQYIHQKGIIHRDIKLGNLLLTQDATVKISDFGLAAYCNVEPQAGLHVGTPYYMAPELWAETLPPAAPTIDIYALGVSLYIMLTGRPPFQAKTRKQLGKAHRHQRPSPPLEYNRRIPRKLSNFILKSLAKKRRSRFQTALEFYEELNSLSLFSEHESGLHPAYAAPVEPKEQPITETPETVHDAARSFTLPTPLYTAWFKLQRALVFDSGEYNATLTHGKRVRKWLDRLWSEAGGSLRPWLSRDGLLLLQHMSHGSYDIFTRTVHNSLCIASFLHMKTLTSWTIRAGYAHTFYIQKAADILEIYKNHPKHWPDTTTKELLQKIKRQDKV